MFAVLHIILAEMGIKRQVDSARRNVHEKAGNQIGKLLSPRIWSEDGSAFLPPTPSCRAVRVKLAPPPARILGGQNTKKKNVLSFFRKNRARANPKCKEHFFFLVSAEALRGGGGAILGAYDLVSLHHALRACDIICFGNRF